MCFKIHFKKSNYYFSQYQEYPDYHDRVRAAGYTIDPDYFKKNNASYKIATGCFVFIVVGFVFQVDKFHSFKIKKYIFRR